MRDILTQAKVIAKIQALQRFYKCYYGKNRGDKLSTKFGFKINEKGNQSWHLETLCGKGFV